MLSHGTGHMGSPPLTAAFALPGSTPVRSNLPATSHSSHGVRHADLPSSQAALPACDGHRGALGVAGATAAVAAATWRRGGAGRSRRSRGARVVAKAEVSVEVGSEAPPSVGDGGRDRLVRYLGGDVSVRAVTATDLVREVCAKHNASPIASIALGRALMGTALLANGRDPGETLQVRISGGGPGGAIIAEATSSLHCRAFIGEPSAEAATVPELVGLGEGATLRVSRTHPFWKSPYTGTVELKCGEIAEDLTQYLAMSEQTPASMGLSVEWDHEAGCVKHAEGFLITLLPGWDEASVGVVETNVASFEKMENPPGVSREDAICQHMMRELAGEFQLEDELKFRCSCSEDRLLTSLMMLGKTEVLRILKEKEPVEAQCDWCGNQLTVTPDQVRAHMKSEQGEWEVISHESSPRGLKIAEEELAKSRQKEMPEPGEADWS